MDITLTTKFDKGDRVRFTLAIAGDDTGTVTDVIVTRDDATESVKVTYRVEFDRNDSPGLTFDSWVLEPVTS